MKMERLKQVKPVLLSIIILSMTGLGLIQLTHFYTRESIKDNNRMMTLRMVNQVMPLQHDNDLLEDFIKLTDPEITGTGHPVTIYRARNNEVPVGIVFMPVIARGYNGKIELAVGISYAAGITGVRVNAHQETKGLGDGIHQDISDWIHTFENKSFTTINIQNWAVKTDGGEFDQVSGATISSRGVINAVKKTLDYYELKRELLYQ